MRIDSSGNVGIGTDLPAHSISLEQSNKIGWVSTVGSDKAAIEFSGVDDSLRFYNNTGSTERMRIDSSGNLLVGMTSANTNNDGVGLRADGLIHAKRADVVATFNRKTSDGTVVQISKDNTVVGSIGSVAGVISYINLDPRSGGTGVGATNTDSVIPVTGTGANADGTKDLGITSSRWRDLYLSGAMYGGGVTSSSDTTSRSSGNAFSGTSSYANWTSWGAGTHTHASFRNGTSQVGYIQTNTTSTTYSTSSDYRLKENVVDLTGATDRIKQIPVRRFNFIADADTTVDGFLAHEVQDIVPEAVTGAKDAMRDEEYEVTPAVLDDDGNVVTEAVMGTRSVPDYQGIDQSKLVPLLTAALQEALTKIDALETRITALEG